MLILAFKPEIFSMRVFTFAYYEIVMSHYYISTSMLSYYYYCRVMISAERYRGAGISYRLSRIICSYDHRAVTSPSFPTLYTSHQT